jgi:hypothetical protein
MAVTIHNTTFTAGGASAAVRVLVHTATANSCILIWTHSNETGSISAVGVGGVAATRLGAVDGGGSRSELWGLTAPAAGNLTISARFVGTGQSRWGLAATTLVGHRHVGGSPFGTFVAATASSDTVNLSVSSTSTDLVVFGLGVSGDAAVTLNNGSLVLDMSHSTVGRLVIGSIAGADPTSISATAAASVTWGLMALPIAAPNVSNITFDNAAGTSTSVNANTFSFLLTATSNAVLLVFVQAGSGQGTVSSIAAGSDQLTNLGSTYYREGARRVEVWGLTAPASGVLTISAVLANDESTNFGIYGVTYTGHRTTNPFGGVVVGSASNTPVASLVVSATLGNLVVYGFMFDNNVDGTVGPGVTKRLGINTYLPGMIADAPGALAVTATASIGSTLAWWGAIGVNLFVSEGAVNFSATVAVTDKRDTVSIPSYLLIRGQSAVTDKRDTVAAPSRLRITGQSFVTDRKDTVAIPARLRITSQASVTDRKDTAAVSAQNRITAAVSAADRRDTVAAPGYLLLSANVAVTDKRDTISIPIVQAGAAFQATVAFTDARDSISISGYLPINGQVSVTDRRDTISIEGTAYSALITGTVSVTDKPDSIQVLANNISESAAVVTASIDPGAGGGHKRKKPPYIRAPEDFWAVRERHLKSLQPEMQESAEPVETPTTASPLAVKSVPPKLQSYRIERASVIQKLQQAPDPPKLYNRTRRLKLLNARIAEQKQQHLLALQAERERARLEKVRRARLRARKLKKAIKLLTIARALSTLTYLYGKL